MTKWNIGKPAANRKVHPILSCANCGHSFEVFAYRMNGKQPRPKYCGYACYWQSLKGRPSPKRNRFTRRCIICGRLFNVNAHRLHNAKYCSFQCHGLDAVQTMPSAHTSIERDIEEGLKKENIDFEAQALIKGICRPDFLIPKSKLVVFCDGDYWHSLPKQVLRDQWQTKRLKEEGYRVIRLSESDIRNNLEDCIAKIQNVM